VSLCLIAIRGAEGVVVTDGAAYAAYADGTSAKTSSTQPKVIELGAIAVCATGSAAMGADVFRIGQYLADLPGGTSFGEVVHNMRVHLPRLHGRDVERLARLHLSPDHAIAGHKVEAGCAVAVVGYDDVLDRARLMVFDDSDGYAGVEGMAHASLGLVDPKGRLNAAVQARTPWHAMPALMEGIVTAMSNEVEGVGGAIYLTRIGPPPAIEAAS
jgi:hypothetical protein